MGEDEHIHGCGHPVRPVLLCDNPISISHWFVWSDDHDEQIEKGEPCECYFCWKGD